jgi:hypothetical protein
MNPDLHTMLLRLQFALEADGKADTAKIIEQAATVVWASKKQSAALQDAKRILTTIQDDNCLDPRYEARTWLTLHSPEN